MKKLIISLLLIVNSCFLAQGNKPFTNYDIGVYGGINFYNIENIKGDFVLEIKTNFISSFKLKASTGFHRTIQPKSYTVRKYSENTLDSIPRYFASKYQMVSKKFDVFPITLGVQYIFVHSIGSPYLSIDLVYNFIDTFLNTSPSENWSYNSLEEIPSEFKESQIVEKFPNSSYGLILAAGTSFQISSKLNLDIRYMFKFDNEIVNTHHFIAGIYF